MKRFLPTLVSLFDIILEATDNTDVTIKVDGNIEKIPFKLIEKAKIVAKF